MGNRQVRQLLGRSVTISLKDQAAAGLFDLNICAVVRLVGEVALEHALASPSPFGSGAPQTER